MSQFGKSNGHDPRRAMAKRIKDAHARCTALSVQLIEQAQEFKSLAVDSNVLIGDKAWGRWLETDCGMSADLLSAYLTLGRLGPSFEAFFVCLANPVKADGDMRS